jgi:hypothetical protein
MWLSSTSFPPSSNVSYSGRNALHCAGKRLRSSRTHPATQATNIPTSQLAQGPQISFLGQDGAGTCMYGMGCTAKPVMQQHQAQR